MFPFVAEISIPPVGHLAYFGLIIPFLIVRGRMKIRDLQRPLPNRLRHFQGTTFMLVMFAVISVLVARSAYDIVAGLTYGRLGKEFGYLPEFNYSPNATRL